MYCPKAYTYRFYFFYFFIFLIFVFIFVQGGMHVNGAPPLMQASMQAGVPAPGQIPAAVTGPGPGSLAPGGMFPLQSPPLWYFAKVLL